jgi:hypothetical protein
MEKFCEFISSESLEIPDLFRKLIEVEYMLNDLPVPEGAYLMWYKKFLAEIPEGQPNQFKAFLAGQDVCN